MLIDLTDTERLDLVRKCLVSVHSLKLADKNREALGRLPQYGERVAYYERLVKKLTTPADQPAQA